MTEAAVGGLLGAGCALLTYAVRGRSSTLFGPSVYRGPRTRPAAALTFDDGPSEGTPRLLEVLDRYGAPATFFQCGANVERLPEMARAVRAAGHEIGNHSYTHPRFEFRSPGFIEQELSRTQAAIQDRTGVIPALFRPPFGIRWFGFREAQRRLNLLGVMWTVLGRDWKLPARAIAARVLKGAGNGAIICLHDGREIQSNPDVRETVEAVRILIPELRARGLHLETVSQLLCPTN